VKAGIADDDADAVAAAESDHHSEKKPAKK